MLYIFGYGSLLYAPGINGRMQRVYKESDLTEAWLYGYRREWNAVWSDNGVRYLGLRPMSQGFVNGVLFPLDEDDFEDFATSEGSGRGMIHPMYRFIDVRTQIGVFEESNLVLSPADRVLTCVTVNPTTDGEIAVQYVNIIKEALQVRGPAFAAEFWKTTV
jgi:hypothetical protein